jgi:hypothetical protein
VPHPADNCCDSESEVTMHHHRTPPVFAAPLALLALATLGAAPASADQQSSLGQAVVAARSASACAPLQPEPLVERVAQMANRSTGDYIAHRSAAVPFTNPLPVLSTIGYSGSKGLLLSGYGATEAAALHALMLQWQGLKPDCSYTQFGASTWHDDAGYDLASVVLATPTQPSH